MAQLSSSTLGRLTDPARKELEAVLTLLVGEAAACLRENFLGAYLVGSFALGEGDEDSDVDFLMVTREKIAQGPLLALQELHARMPDSLHYWAQHLEGSYVSAPALRNDPVVFESWWWVDNGSRDLIEDQHDNTAVTRWILREHGITLAGPDPRGLVDAVTAEELRAEAAVHLKKWHSILHLDPAGLENAWLQQYAVLACCRARFTMATGLITSKIAAGRWAIEHLDPAWAGHIQRAIDDRPDPWGRVHRMADPAIVAATLSFIEGVQPTPRDPDPTD